MSLYSKDHPQEVQNCWYNQISYQCPEVFYLIEDSPLGRAFPHIFTQVFLSQSQSPHSMVHHQKVQNHSSVHFGHQFPYQIPHGH